MAVVVEVRVGVVVVVVCGIWKARYYQKVKVITYQDSFIMRQPEDVEAEFGEDDEDVVVDAGNNADLYEAN